MKKFAAIILLLLYSSANFGLSLRLDYCGTSLSDIAFYSEEKELAECCKMLEIPEDCCSSEQVFIQDNSDKSFSSTAVQTIDFGGFTTTEAYVSATPIISHKPVMAVPYRKAPPETSGRLSWLCSYQI